MADTRNRTSSNGTRWALPPKGTLSPAEVFDHTVSPSSDSIPRDYFSDQAPRPASPMLTTTSTLSGKVTSNSQTSEELTGISGSRRVSRTNEMLLHRSIDSPPHSPKYNHFTITESPYSSTDSLASLVERQRQNKIIHPSHQKILFCKTNDTPLNVLTSQRRATAPHVGATGRRSSTASLLAVLQGQAPKKRVSDTTSNIPTVKSPLAHESRRMNPHHNPYHVHSSPSVKESKKVSLGYDPVSRKKVLNSYEIIKEIGRGEHGKVKLAKHLENGELVALKIVDRKGPRRHFKPGSSQEEKIRREIAIMKKINHPNVVQLKEVMDDANSRKIYLVLEYLEKGEVKWQKAKDVPMMTLKESMVVFRDVLLGLEYLHYQGIIHRDIKPANLLIAGDGSVKISDFGVSFASSLKTGEQDDYDLAKTAGTPAFLAPELCRPLDESENEHPKITYKIDIWALGVTLYCFLFGKLPFWATNEFELFNVIYSEDLKFPEKFPEDFTDEDKKNAIDLLSKILDKDPKKRLRIKNIKRHPLTLRDLSEDEISTYTQEQQSCQCKIDVSHEEVDVAVTGLGTKLRNGIAKALKFAGLQKKSPTKATGSVSPESDGSTSSLHVNGHRRIKSGDVQAETLANVEGDLFLNTCSAVNSLNNIFNDDDQRRSSVSLSTHAMSSPSTSTGSSIPKGTQLVSLPVNASFASLDSVYLDNHAPSYAYTSVTDSRGPPLSSQTDSSATATSEKDIFLRMKNFEMNKSSRKKSDNAVAPTFLLNGEEEPNSDEEEDESSKREIESTGRTSEVSVPSILMKGFSTEVIDAEPVTKSSTSSTSRSSKLPTRGAPKYSFFETSDDEDDYDDYEDEDDGDSYFGKETYDTGSASGPEVVFAESTDDEVTPVFVPQHTLDSNQFGESPSPPDNHDSDTDSDDGELMLSFNNVRRRHNSIAISPHLDLNIEDMKKLDRVASPLSHNAPKTPISSSNAHLIAQHPPQQYTNHYHRVNPQVEYHQHHNVDTRGRSNSITVGLLKGASPGQTEQT